MGRPSAIPTEEKLRLVLSVISGEMTPAQAARHGKVGEQSMSRWKQQFLSGGKAALGEAHVQLRVWKRSVEGRVGPLRTQG